MMTTVEMEPEAAGQMSPATPLDVMLQLLFGKHITYSISALARLGVADHMNGQPKTAEELAPLTDAHAPSLYRVMRLLASVGVLNELPGKRFTLTSVGGLLKSNAPNTVRNLAIMWGDPFSTHGFGRLGDVLRTGVDGVTTEFGKHIFDLLPEFPEQAKHFNDAMSDFSAVIGPAVVEAYNFTGINRIADVGGGHGRLLASVLDRYPGTHGVLFDLPEVVAGAFEAGHISRFKDRVDIEAGSFFECAPAACDAYLLKHIIHDWDDDRACRILSLIREQMNPEARVLLCELVVPDEPGPSPAKALDIEMLALTPGGRERTAAEFSRLLARSGLRLTRVIPTQSPLSVIEACLA
jgi:O-methyltransferase domain